MAQSGKGRIELFYDFFGEDNIANTAATRALGPFIVGGQGTEETGAGIPTLHGGLSGVGVITTDGTIDHTTLVGTPCALDVLLMGTIVIEARVRFGTDLLTKETFFGLTSVDPDTLSLEVDLLLTDGSNTLTLRSATFVGFYQSAELSDTNDWHAVYNGGAVTGETDTENIDLDVDAVTGEWQVLRLEVDNNGTTRWYVDGVLKKTLVGAASTTANFGVVLGVEAKGGEAETLDVDYLLVRANRDWTV